MRNCVVCAHADTASWPTTATANTHHNTQKTTASSEELNRAPARTRAMLPVDTDMPNAGVLNAWDSLSKLGVCSAAIRSIAMRSI